MTSSWGTTFCAFVDSYSNIARARLLYKSADASFVSLSEEQRMRAFAHCDSHQQCLSCGFQAMQSSIAHPRPLPGGGFAQRDFTYHLHDFVYIKSKKAHSVYRIGQIIKLRAMKVPIEITVQLFGRYDGVVRRVKAEEKHRLIPSDDVSASPWITVMLADLSCSAGYSKQMRLRLCMMNICKANVT